MSEHDMTGVAGRIVTAREASGLTAAQLARRLGVQTKTLLRWESGESEPRSNRLVNLAGLLNVSAAWLLSGEGAKPVRDTTAIELARLHGDIEDVRASLERLAEVLSRAAERLAALQEDSEATEPEQNT